MKSFFKKFIFILGDEKSKLKYLTALFLLSSLLDVLGIALIGPFFNKLNNSNTGITLNIASNSTKEFIACMIIFVFVFKGIVAYFVNKKILYYSYNQQGILIKKIMKSYQKCPLEKIISINTAEVINIINNFTNTFASSVLMNILSLAANLLIVIAIILFLAIQNIMIISILVALMVISTLFYDFFFKKSLKKTGVIAAQAQENIIKWVNQSLGGFKEINLLNVDKFFYEKVSKQTDDYAESNSIANALQLIPRYVIEDTVIIFVVSILIIQYRTSGNINEIMALLSMYAVSAIRLMPAVNESIRSISKMRFSLPVIDKLYDVLQNLEFEESFQSNKDSSLFKNFNEVKLLDVSYKYPETKNYALDNVSIAIQKGQSIGIIGKSGSGKTTLVNIILGLLAIQKGSLVVDEIVINDKKKMYDWRKHLAYIPQDIFLLDDSIARNIAFGINDSDYSESQILHALKVAHLYDFVNTLPNKLDTMVGERGVKLSGGQRQRIAIARAIYHDRNIIVMDEATSALDNETEKTIVDAIEGLKGDRTLIVIAHRHTTLKNCDYIYKMEDGSIVAHGKYDSICK